MSETHGPDRAIWRCERCNAYHIGGLDLTETEEPGDGGGTWTAICGATTTTAAPATELSETPFIATDPYNAAALMGRKVMEHLKAAPARGVTGYPFDGYTGTDASFERLCPDPFEGED